MPDRFRRLIGGETAERTSVDEFRRTLNRLETITHEQRAVVGRGATEEVGDIPADLPPDQTAGEQAEGREQGGGREKGERDGDRPPAPRPVATARRPPNPRATPSTAAGDVAALQAPIDSVPKRRAWRRVPALVLVTTMAVLLALWAVGVTTGNKGNGHDVASSRPPQRTNPTGAARPKPVARSPQTTAAPAPPPSAPAATPAATPVGPTTPGGTTFAVPGDRLHTVLTATADCWLQARAPDGTPFTGVLHAGQSQTLDTASPLRLRVGNPAGLGVTVNGRPLAVAASGQAVTLTVTGGAPPG